MRVAERWLVTVMCAEEQAKAGCGPDECEGCGDGESDYL
jgi:hypothetical protein